MKKLGDFLGRFAQFARESDEARTTVITVLETVGIKGLTIERVTIRSSVVTLSLSAIQKNEVFLKQGKILSLLHEHALTKHIEKVR